MQEDHQYHITLICITFSVLIGAGTVMFKVLEPFTWIQALYFSVSTMTTVGYGDLVPSNDLTRLVVSFYVLISVTLYISLATYLGQYYIDRRISHHERNKDT